MTTNEQTIAQATDLKGRAIGAINWSLDHWWVWPLALFALWLFLFVRGKHALLGALDERADAAFGDVDAMLAERQALIGNLATTVRAFAAHEKQVINDVLLGRVDALEALGGGAVMAANTQVAAALQNVFSVSDQFPRLAADAHYQGLRQDLIRLEEKITASRKYYNLAVEEANAVRRSFPANLLARFSAAPAREKFSLGERRAEFVEPVQIQL